LEKIHVARAGFVEITIIDSLLEGFYVELLEFSRLLAVIGLYIEHGRKVTEGARESFQKTKKQRCLIYSKNYLIIFEINWVNAHLI